MVFIICTGAIKNLHRFFAIPIINTLIQNDSKSIKDRMHMQTRNSYPPIIFGTEIESNLLIKNNAFYQMIVYHWSDGNKVAQPNINTLVKITWKNNN